MPYRGRELKSERITHGLHARITSKGRWYILSQGFQRTLSDAALRFAEEENAYCVSFNESTWPILAYEVRKDKGVFQKITNIQGTLMDETELFLLLSKLFAGYLKEIGVKPDRLGQKLWESRNRFDMLVKQRDPQVITNARSCENAVIVKTADGKFHRVTTASFLALNTNAILLLSDCRLAGDSTPTENAPASAVRKATAIRRRVRFPTSQPRSRR